MTKLTNANVCASGLRLVSGYACEQKEPRPRHGDVDVGDVVGRQFASTRQMSDAGTATSNIIPRFDYTLAKKLLQEGKCSSEVVAAAERLGDHQLKRSIERHIESLRGSHSLKKMSCGASWAYGFCDKPVHRARGGVEGEGSFVGARVAPCCTPPVSFSNTRYHSCTREHRERSVST